MRLAAPTRCGRYEQDVPPAQWRGQEPLHHLVRVRVRVRIRVRVRVRVGRTQHSCEGRSRCITAGCMRRIDEGMLVRCDLVRCDLVGCDLVRCDLVGCDLVRCELVGCDLVRCVLVMLSVPPAEELARVGALAA